MAASEVISRSSVLLIYFLAKSHSAAQIYIKSGKSQIKITIHTATQDTKPLFLFVCFFVLPKLVLSLIFQQNVCKSIARELGVS